MKNPLDIPEFPEGTVKLFVSKVVDGGWVYIDAMSPSDELASEVLKVCLTKLNETKKDL